MLKFQQSAVSLIALMGAMSALPANAQEADSNQQAASGFASTDIIVTAQRREERNQDVPISITAFSNEMLDDQNIVQAQDLAGTVPSLIVSSGAQASRNVQSFTLRGISGTYQGGASVVQYLSEVPLIQGFSTSQQGGPGNYIDLENLQVLAGPQGTLFGRNTTGGAVLIVPKKPTNNFEGYIEASVGNYDYRGVEAVVNIPIVPDKLMIRAVGTFQDRDGYTRDIVFNKDRDDMHYYAGRIGITFRPTESFENYTLVFGSWSDTNGTTYILDSLHGALANDPIAIRQLELQQALGKRKVRLDNDAFEKTDTSGVINKTSIELADTLTLNNIVSYQHYRQNLALDEDGTPLQLLNFGTFGATFPIAGLCDEFNIACNGASNNGPSGPRDDTQQFTEELQLQGSFLDNHLTYTVGGFYLNQTPAGRQFARNVFLCAPAQSGTCAPIEQTFKVSQKSKAVYGQATLDMGAFTPALESLRLTAGYRHTWDRIRGQSLTIIPFGPVGFCLTTGTVIPIEDCETGNTLKENAGTWTVGLDYKPISDVLLFAKVSRGYKAGGYNPFAARRETLVFRSENVTAYEAGFKSDWRFGTVPLRLNATAYYTDYDPLQRSIPDVNEAGFAGSASFSSTATIKGFEVEATVRPFPMLELSGNVAHNDAKAKEFAYITLLPDVGCDGPVAAGELLDRSCEPLGLARWTYNLRATLDLPIPEAWGNLSLFANYAYISTRGTDANPGELLEPYGLLNLSANWRKVAGSDFDLQLFMTNATNKLYRNTNAALSSLGFNSNIYGEPRMYGLRVRYNFGQD